MSNSKDDKNIILNERKDITILNSSLAKRGVELLSRPKLKDIIRFGKKISASNISQLIKIDILGEGELKKIIWSEANKSLIAATSSGIYVYNTKDFKKTKMVDDPSTSIVISSDNTTLASTATNGDISIWQIKDWSLLKSIKTQTSNWIRAMAISSDGTNLASLAENEPIRIWRVSDGLLIKTLGEDTENKLNNRRQKFHSVTFSADNSLLATGTTNCVQLWQVKDGSLFRSYGIGHFVNQAIFSPDDKLLAYTNSAAEIYMNSILYTTEIYVIRLSDGLVIMKYILRDFSNAFLVFSPDSETLAIYKNYDEQILVIRVADGKLISTLKADTKNLVSVSFSADGKFLAASLTNGTILIWETEKFNLLKCIPGGNAQLNCFDLSPSSDYLATGLNSYEVQIWRIADGQHIRTLRGHNNWVQKVKFSPTGNILASGDTDGETRLWRFEDGKLLRTFREHKSTIQSIAFSPDGAILATAGWRDENVYLWRTKNGTKLKTLPPHPSYISHLTFSPDGLQLASSCSDGNIYIRRVADGVLLHKLSGMNGNVWTSVYSPDGSILASGAEGKIFLWNIIDGSLILTMEDNTSNRPILDISFSSDGSVISSTSFFNRFIKIWRASDGLLLAQLKDHIGEGRCTKFSGNGLFLASASCDGISIIWGVPPL